MERGVSDKFSENLGGGGEQHTRIADNNLISNARLATCPKPSMPYGQVCGLFVQTESPRPSRALELLVELNTFEGFGLAG